MRTCNSRILDTSTCNRVICRLYEEYRMGHTFPPRRVHRNSIGAIYYVVVAPKIRAIKSRRTPELNETAKVTNLILRFRQ